MLEGNIIKKIPGDVKPLKTENQGYIDKLEDKTMIELKDILQRQDKLLANKSFLSKLPDCGEKIEKFRNKIQKEILHRDEVEKTANLLSRLNIVSEGKNAMNELEWTGKYEEKSSTQIVVLDLEEETDPLKILAQPTGTGVHKKQIINLPPDKSLITAEDLAEISSLDHKEPPIEEHVKYIIDKVEKPSDSEKNEKEYFKPYKTTMSNVHDPIKEKQRKKHDHWEITAATPPLIVHGATKLLSLNESLRLQAEYKEKLEKIQAKHAIEQLTHRMGEHEVGEIPREMGHYRTNDQDSNTSYSEDEVHDDEDDDRAGTVSFPINS